MRIFYFEDVRSLSANTSDFFGFSWMCFCPSCTSNRTQAPNQNLAQRGPIGWGSLHREQKPSLRHLIRKPLIDDFFKLFNVSCTHHHFPQQEQAHLIQVVTKPARETPKQFFFCIMRAFRQTGNGPRPLHSCLRAGQTSVYREQE